GQGARLHESPDLPYHRALSRYAIARPEQIDRSVPRHADLWVRALDPDQVERYAENIAVVVDELAAAGSHDIACEVLSTAPFPLVEVLRRYALGRFRVTQKADLANPRDGYRSENAEPRDWIMVGTHDTAPLARVVDGWLGSGTAGGPGRPPAPRAPGGRAGRPRPTRRRGPRSPARSRGIEARSCAPCSPTSSLALRATCSSSCPISSGSSTSTTRPGASAKRT